MRSGRRTLAAVVVALVATSCGGAGTPEAAPPAPEGRSPASTTPATGDPGVAASPVAEVLRFTAAGVDGSQVDGAAYAGKDVALWFWAPW